MVPRTITPRTITDLLTRTRGCRATVPLLDLEKFAVGDPDAAIYLS